MFVTNGAEAQTLVIHTFGGFAVYVGTEDHSLRFVTQSVEALLVYLACQGRAVGRDTTCRIVMAGSHPGTGVAQICARPSTGYATNLTPICWSLAKVLG